jgi:ankyrin repeat protein
VAQYLVEKWHESLLRADGEGLLPLHSAVADLCMDPDMVMFLANQSPQSVRIRTHKGDLPLHLAVQNESGLEVELVEPLVDAWPESVQEKSGEGVLPLHLAAKIDAFRSLRYLVEKWPVSAQEKTDQGWLAVHLALKYVPDGSHEAEAMFQTARFLVELFPQSAFERTNEGYLPIHVAAMHSG